MKRVRLNLPVFFALFAGVVLQAACSFHFQVVIANDSDETIEVRYTVGENGQFDDPAAKTLAELQAEKGISRLWTESKPWQNLSPEQFSTDPAKRERAIKIPPGEAVRIELGAYNPVREERGELSEIVELRIISKAGELSYKGKLLLAQFEKDEYTFIKTYRNGLKNNH